MAVRVRKDVWSLPAGDQTLDWYGRAVAVLRGRPLSDPTSWSYLAAVHGIDDSVAAPGNAGTYWRNCQHQNWFFLPWHRAYLAMFEAIIADCVARQGGPGDWALPYWNYSADQTTNPSARIMPAAFVSRTRSDGSQNPLWSPRNQNNNGDFQLSDARVSLAAMGERIFAGATSGGTPGFGGPRVGPAHFGGTNGRLESVPHNVMHTGIGGLMSDPDTAALDPIFWLHHCNIDRLWEVWRNQRGVGASPADAGWRGTSFPIHDATGAETTLTVAGVLDTTQILHGYSYDTTPVATAMVDGGDDSAIAAQEPVQTAELVAATSDPISLTSDISTTTLPLALDRTSLSFADPARPTPNHVYIGLENVTGTGVPGDVSVYVSATEDTSTATFAGVLATFGIARASSADSDHGGSGITEMLDITDLAQQLGLSDGSAGQISVFLQADQPAPIEEDPIPDDFAAFVAARPDPSITIGRVSLYFATETSGDTGATDTSNNLVAGGPDGATPATGPTARPTRMREASPERGGAAKGCAARRARRRRGSRPRPAAGSSRRSSAGRSCPRYWPGRSCS